MEAAPPSRHVTIQPAASTPLLRRSWSLDDMTVRDRKPTFALGGIVIAVGAAALLTALFVIAGSHRLGAAASLLWILAAPAMVLSLQTFSWIHHVSPPLYSTALAHHSSVRAAVFFAVSVLWISVIWSPALFRIRLFRCSLVASQILVFLLGGVLSLACLYVVMRSFPHPD